MSHSRVNRLSRNHWQGRHAPASRGHCKRDLFPVIDSRRCGDLSPL